MLLTPDMKTFSLFSVNHIVTETQFANITCINCFQFAETSAGERGNRGMTAVGGCSLTFEELTFAEDLLTPSVCFFFFFFFFWCLPPCFWWLDSSVLWYFTFLTTWSKYQHDSTQCGVMQQLQYKPSVVSNVPNNLLVAEELSNFMYMILLRKWFSESMDIRQQSAFFQFIVLYATATLDPGLGYS